MPGPRSNPAAGRSDVVGIGPYDGCMLRNLIRTLRGPSNDPRMAYISRPLPGDLPDEEVVEALEIGLRENPDPTYLVETLPPALKQVTGRDLQVLDCSARDVTGRFVKRQVMIRQGDVGRWRGYQQNPYPLIAPPSRGRRPARGTDGGEGDRPEPMPGWAPPPPPKRPAG